MVTNIIMTSSLLLLQLDRVEEMVTTATEKYRLSDKIKNALIDIIKEFEINLK